MDVASRGAARLSCLPMRARRCYTSQSSGRPYVNNVDSQLSKFSVAENAPSIDSVWHPDLVTYPRIGGAEPEQRAGGGAGIGESIEFSHR